MNRNRTRRQKVAIGSFLNVYLSEMQLKNVAVLQLQRNQAHLIPACLFRRNEVPRIRQFAESTVPRYDDLDFKFHFRLDRSTTEILITKLSHSEALPSDLATSRGKAPVTLSKQLLMFLWFVGNIESFRTMSDRFGVSQSTYHAVCRRIATAVVDDIMPQVITWPNTAAERAQVNVGFQRLGRLPNTSGAVDGTHIKITAPEKHPESYFNRKHFYSMHLQGICTSDLRFIHVLTGRPGSVHGARVFRNCYIMEDNEDKIPAGYYLIGDSAYPLTRFLMTPFRDVGNLGADQRRFNRELSGQRNVIERAFGLLKGRFLRLQFFRADDIVFLCNVILAACTMHNICIMNDDQLMEEYHGGNDEEVVHYPYQVNRTGQQKRNELMAALI